MATAKELQKTVNDNREECLVSPATDIFETSEGYNLKLEMPGVTKENLHITVDNDELEVRGDVLTDSPEGKEMKYTEYTTFNFYRKFKIGTDIDRNEIKASLDNGVLTLDLQKSEAAKPRKIEVQGS